MVLGRRTGGDGGGRGGCPAEVQNMYRHVMAELMETCALSQQATLKKDYGWSPEEKAVTMYRESELSLAFDGQESKVLSARQAKKVFPTWTDKRKKKQPAPPGSDGEDGAPLVSSSRQSANALRGGATGPAPEVVRRRAWTRLRRRPSAARSSARRPCRCFCQFRCVANSGASQLFFC